MPVIRQTATGPVLKGEDRAVLTAQLAEELAGKATENGPLIFEIPVSEGKKIDVLVVWEKWKEKAIPSQTRSDVIPAAYGKKKTKIAQPLGVTYKEALEQNLLPYAVVPMSRKNEIPTEQLKHVMKQHGGFVLEDDKVDLRFPTLEMAQDAHAKLVDEMPKGYWSIVHSIGPME
jgi:hypothetical protein